MASDPSSDAAMLQTGTQHLENTSTLGLVGYIILQAFYQILVNCVTELTY